MRTRIRSLVVNSFRGARSLEQAAAARREASSRTSFIPTVSLAIPSLRLLPVVNCSSVRVEKNKNERSHR